MKLDTIEAAILSMMAFTFGCLITLISVQIIVTDPLRKEAIEKGYASWEVVDQTSGKTQFKFK
jgi:hypothetical protein